MMRGGMRGGRGGRGGGGAARGGKVITKGQGLIDTYAQNANNILPMVVDSNPDMEKKVAEMIHDHVVELIGNDNAAEVTAHLVNLPVK
jgi:hypothetical protein